MQKQSIMGEAPDVPVCDMSLDELLLHALVIEREAEQRYRQLAEMMARIGNKKGSENFRENVENRSQTLEDDRRANQGT